MESNSKGSCYANWYAKQVRSADYKAINKIVKSVSNKVCYYERMHLLFCMRKMVVVPVNDFFKYEKGYNSRHYIKRHVQAPAACFLNDFRKKMNKSISKKAASSKAHKIKKDFFK